MKINYALLITGLTAGLVSSFAFADDNAADTDINNVLTQSGIVKIEWLEPSSFRDIDSSSGLQSRFEQRLFDTLTKALDKDAKKSLKANQTLELVVTNLDLAGDMRPTFGAAAVSELRIVKDLYPPRMTFSYRVLEDGKVIMVGDEKLTDMNFMHHVGVRKDGMAEYESRMLADWLKKTVAPKA
ncbi:DUF3016 domain-containing protein [Shewanella sp. SR44-3]|uniref:DUF3016 domain-containing protein n=1 Tax=Shewanella sp. SR44-3 TaxID=2760936 RepID=UPI0015FAD26D|nr:DUF3016 domain-containing protein [Shewanella sp. SR44-3]MBB1268204.1 DUF3016 domain-containing protein [Shewanella sp. SR44-3]